MARHRDDDTVRPDETSPQGAAIDDDPILDRPDPLGLGGTPPPDAPSRRARPWIVALLVEFFRMSRTTAILLGAFVLAGVLYLLVRDEPVVAFGPQPAQDPTGTSEPAEPAEPAEPVDPSSTPTDQTTETTAPTPSSSPTPTGTGSRTTSTTVTGGTATTGPDAEGFPGGADPQAPQQQQPQQSPQQQPDQQSQPQLQQEAPGAGETSVPGGALEG